MFAFDVNQKKVDLIKQRRDRRQVCTATRKKSGYTYIRDFKVGYNPERISLERAAPSGAQA